MNNIGPFRYTGPSGYVAWGYRFPSGFIIMEWCKDSVPEDDDVLNHGHQSVYHSWDDFRMVCEGEVEWSVYPDRGNPDELVPQSLDYVPDSND